jgi:hypothetical protein
MSYKPFWNESYKILSDNLWIPKRIEYSNCMKNTLFSIQSYKNEHYAPRITLIKIEYDPPRLKYIQIRNSNLY